MDGATQGAPALYVYPGRIETSTDGRRLTTVLGSCVAVCLLDPARQVAGMNHFLLPETGGNGSSSLRHATPAVRQLVERLLDLGASRSRLVAKVFGGCVPADPSSNGFHVGWRNVESARRLLQDEQIPILAEDVGGPYGRRVVFCTGSGSAWVRKFRGAS